MDDATTATDGGFRVGRRVRVNLEGDRHHGLEGELRWIPGHDEESTWWHIKFGDKPVNPADAFHQSILLLLPEPDAPATPEPPADDILFTKQINIGNLPELEPDVSALVGRPHDYEPDKPDHYAKLRDAGCEPFAVIRACLTPSEAVAYHRGTAIVYLMRAGLKHPTPDDDIRKAHAHLTEAVAILDGKVA